MDDGSYIEAGIRFGDGSQYQDHPCAGICYAVFWDETRNGTQLKHIISQSAAGNPRIELAVGQYQGHWIIKLNGTQVGTAVMVTRLTTQRIDVGMEVEQITCDATKSWGKNLGMHSQIQDAGGTLHDTVWNLPLYRDCSALSLNLAAPNDGFISWFKPNHY